MLLAFSPDQRVGNAGRKDMEARNTDVAEDEITARGFPIGWEDGQDLEWMILDSSGFRWVSSFENCPKGDTFQNNIFQKCLLLIFQFDSPDVIVDLALAEVDFLAGKFRRSRRGKAR
jgi:hypothetical protein